MKQSDACTICGGKTQVLTTRGGVDEQNPRSSPEGIRRRRECLTCRHRFTTTEIRLNTYKAMATVKDLKGARAMLANMIDALQEQLDLAKQTVEQFDEAID